MKDGEYGFIYITTNLINGKMYIGQKKYNNNWETYLGSGILLTRSIKKYGKENFKREIIDNCNSKKQLDEREIYWISYYNAVESDKFYNIAYGGLGGKNINCRKIICLNTNEIFDTIQEGSNKYNIKRDGVSACCNNLTMYARAKDKTRLTWMWYEEYSIATNEEIANKLFMCENSRRGEYSNNYGTKHTKETLIKMSISQKKLKHDSNCKKVICLNTKEIFDSLKKAQLKHPSAKGISKCCAGKIKYSGKLNEESLIWMYYDEYLTDIDESKNKLKYIYQDSNKVKVVCLNNGLTFNSITEATKWCNLKSVSNIKRCCEGVVKTAGRNSDTGEMLRWKYLD